jgi:hypothetical protein
MSAYDFDSRCGAWRGPGGRFVPPKRGRRHADRLGRAVELLALGCVVPDGEGQGFVVASIDGRYLYHVVGHGCDCPDAYFRRAGTCKHRLAVALARRRLAALMRETGDASARGAS